jgi:hypothetical protein
MTTRRRTEWLLEEEKNNHAGCMKKIAPGRKKCLSYLPLKHEDTELKKDDHAGYMKNRATRRG